MHYRSDLFLDPFTHPRSHQMPGWQPSAGQNDGTFFLLYVAMVIWVARSLRWRTGRLWLALLASVIPFGSFIFDAWLRRQPDAFGVE